MSRLDYCFVSALVLAGAIGCGGPDPVQIPTTAVLYDKEKDKVIFKGGSKDMKKGKGGQPASGSPPG